MTRRSVASRGAPSRPVSDPRAEGLRGPDPESGSWLVLLRSEGEPRHRAIVAWLTRLDDYRGESRFTTPASRFALFKAAVAVRRQA